MGNTLSIYQFCAIPQIMAIATMLECYNNPLVFTGVVKIRAGQAAYLMLSIKDQTDVDECKACFRAQVLELLDELKQKATSIADTTTLQVCDQAMDAVLEESKSKKRKYE